jgi:hypothetical protein
MAPEFAPAVLVGRRLIIGGKVTIECGHDAQELVFLGHVIFLRTSFIAPRKPLNHSLVIFFDIVPLRY